MPCQECTASCWAELYVADLLDISLRPMDCLCPDSSYTCEVNDATEIQWIANTTSDTDVFFQYTVNSGDSDRETDDLKITFTRESASVDYYKHFAATLQVTNLDLNGSDIQCIGFNLTMNVSKTVQVCIRGTCTTAKHL